MNKRVYNRTVGKIFRTFGFLLILLVSLIIGAEMVAMSDASFLASVVPIATQITDIVPAALNDYLGIGIVAGLLCLVWAIRRGLVLRLLLTVVLVVVFIVETHTAISFLTGYMLSAPSWLDSALDAIAGPIDQLLAISPWVAPGAALLVVILLWSVFANARPKRFSIFFLRVSTITLFFGIVAQALLVNLTATFTSATWFTTVLELCYLVSFALIAVGSALGVIGFYRK